MSKKAVFVDTGAWFALADKSDQFHTKSALHFKKLIDDGYELLTTNLIVHETAMLLLRKLSKKAAIAFLDEVYCDELVQIIHCDPAIEDEAYAIFRKYPEHDFSIVDCVSFTILKSENLKRVFSFDKHFKIMRFILEP